MNRWMTRLARPGNCGDFGARGLMGPGAAGVVAGDWRRGGFFGDLDRPGEAVEAVIAGGAAVDDAIDHVALLHRDAADARVGGLLVHDPRSEQSFARADQPAAHAVAF